MKLCKTCKHWRAFNGDDDAALRGAGICNAAKVFWDETESEPETPGNKWFDRRQLKAEAAGVLCLVMGQDAPRAKLVTMENFGCVQHAPA